MSKIRHFTNKMTRTKRTISNASLDADTRRGSISERARSVSEIMDSSKVPRNHEYLLLYLGYAWVGEPRSTKELQAGIRNVQTSSLTQRTVSVTHSNGDLTVMEISGDKLLESPLQYVAQVAPDDIKGSGHCVAISFHSGHNDNQCHVFQAKTNREAADVVQAIQKACRSATKGLKSRKTSDATFPRPKSSQSEAQRMPRPRMCMEDEDELLEFKKAPSAFSSSKKSHNRVSSELLSSTSPSSASSPRASINSSDSMASRSKSKRRNMSGIPSDGMFTREDRVNQLSSAVFKIRENNSFLKDKASKVKNPSTPFEDALYAMTTENLELLRNYLSCGHVSSNDTDVNGNTLLHYSVAMGRIDTVRIVCNSSGTSLEAPGWNDCHALHRAAAEGNIPILQLLLRRGVNVNGMDIMRRTPLHITCGKMELVECSIALLEYGAQIMATDVLGLRPCDVNPDLKEVQNRLINSACESFVSSQVRDSGLVSSPSATPFSSSPTSTRPSSIASAKSHDLCADVDGQLSHLLDTVSLRARALHRVYADKTRHSLTHRTTRSHDNLSELQEKDEDEMARKDRLELKFPSELQLYSTAYAVEGDANAVLSAMERLKTRAGDFKNKKGLRVDSGRGLSLDLDVEDCDSSLSEPNLVSVGGARTDEIPPDVPRPFSSTAILDRTRHHKAETHSTGTLRSQPEDLDSLDQAFNDLQEEVTSSPSPTERPPVRRAQRPPHLNTRLPKLSTEETHAIFEDIITDMRTFSDNIDSPLSSPHTPHTPLTPNAHTPHTPLTPNAHFSHMPETKSEVTESKDPPTNGTKTETVEPPKMLELSDTDTMKKIKKKMSAVKRISSPLTKVRRKSVSGKAEEKEKLKEKLSMMKRQVTMPEIPLDRGKISGNAVALGLVALDPLPSCEPVNTALKLMVTLSSNKECTATLISYICLPKCEAKLLKLAQDKSTTPDMLTDIAMLLQNMFASGGGEGRKNALNSGVLDLTIKLLNGRNPIPGTCLSLLNSLLVSEDDTDFLRTIIRIPTDPLLLYLEPCEPPDGDTSRRGTTVSVATSDSGLSRGKARGTSIDSEISETSSGRQALSPSLQGPAVTHLEAKRIVLKMLAVASNHHKMQKQLSNERAVGLVADCLHDPSLENVTNSVITLANVAQHTGSHKLLIQMDLVDKFAFLLSNGPRPRYHAARALVYLGKLNLLQDFSLFEPTATGYETDVVVTTTDGDGHVYARGATIEKCVEFITGDVLQLWGGFHLSIGPSSSPTNDHPLSPKATKEQIINFFLTTYQSFVRPIILMRLLLHRLATPRHPQNPFNWCLPTETSTLPHSPQHIGYTIPSTQMSVLALIGHWLESFPDDFLDFSELQPEVNKVVKRLRLTRGPFIPHTHRLRSLMQDLGRPRNEKHSTSVEEELRVPHHDNLYQLCKQMVTGGHLPVTLDEAIYISALQLHIEDVNDPFSHIAPSSLSSTLPKSKKGFTMRMKSALPIGYTKTKTLLKRVKVQIELFEDLSERNSKHLYIERCQSNPGYDCTFFSVKVPSGGRFKKGVQKQLLGISGKSVVFLEEKTKELVSSHPLAAVLSVSRENDPCHLVLHLRGDPTGCKVQAESAAAAREIANVLEQCREGEGMLEDSVIRDRWSDSIPSLFTISCGAGELDESISTPTSSLERGATPPLTSHDLVKNIHSPFESPLANGGLTRKSDTLKAFTQDDSLVTDLTDNRIGGVGHVPFCDCPPDPELPVNSNLKHLTLTEVLSCPMEVARQMTLIAHGHFCSVKPAELLQKVSLIPKISSTKGAVSKATDRGSQSSPGEDKATAIKKLADRFNQVGNWVAHSILQYEYLDERVEAVQQFIKISKHCLDMGNTSSVMAIVVAGLGSSPIRRLAATWEMVPKADMELFKRMDSILEERNNYKCYRENLNNTETPSVPYIGVFLKDLTFICDGNPDYLRGGLINLHKRRQVYKTLEEIHHFQQDHYKLHHVPEVQEYLLSHQLMPADDLHSLSLTVEPRITRSASNHGTRSLSASQKSFFKLTRASSASASNLHKT